MVRALLAGVVALSSSFLPLSVATSSFKQFGCPSNTTADEVLASTNLTGKVAIVTGGDNGLGYATAMALAKRGGTVVIGNRNVAKGAAAALNITKASGVEAHALALDLGNLTSVRSFSKQFLDMFGHKLHILVNNAGISGPSKLSSDGFESVFEIDFLGHFLLTDLVLPALRESAPARVVNLGSGAHENACETAGWRADCFKDWSYLPPPVVPERPVVVHYESGPVTVNASSYGISKFAMIQHARALARREDESKVKAYSLTPGFVATSMTSGFDPSSPFAKLVCKGQVHPDPSIPANPCPFSADQGAAMIVDLATGADSDATNGAYFSRTWACQQRPIIEQGFTDKMLGEFYDRALSWVQRADGSAATAADDDDQAVVVVV
eukprot:CAMPEP_0206464826 /NCGR_PEP_ID=MMETSP0324_2-20121206/27449_1 /ASSEMBLY_ACC=CAM_ASM_000836 /TAXON_ID=2866 /ORGANISM="Crypthecodinium cohnii, Strain Seligo" /LENGTH=381 /DNA_ID=CAMNT_0053937535 /DNA_START=35 /DNA_END=1180 /DNA_ORIENTATION=-